jgi:hypothetical protein
MAQARVATQTVPKLPQARLLAESAREAEEDASARFAYTSNDDPKGGEEMAEIDKLYDWIKQDLQASERRTLESEQRARESEQRVRDIQEEIRRTNAVNMTEMREFRRESKAEMAAFRAEVKQDIQGIREEVREQLQATETRLTSRMDSVEAEVKAQTKEARGIARAAYFGITAMVVAVVAIAVPVVMALLKL